MSASYETFEMFWLAGLLEGEGSFMPGPPSDPRQPRITVTMTDEDVIRHVALLFGERKATRQAAKSDGRQDTWVAQIRGNPAVDLMKQLRPMMGTRRRAQIDRAIASLDSPRRGNGTKHGVYMYKQGCRCDECKAAKQDEYRRRRAT